MTPAELRSYFRALADEPDYTFLTTTDVDLYLTIGYNQFRQAVANIDPYIYATAIDFDVSSTREVNLTTLSTPVLGSSVAAGNRLLQLIALEAVNSEGDVTFEFRPVNSASALSNTRFGFIWRGQRLVFGADVTETLRLTYLPEANVTWSGSSELDDMTMFHDMVALFAYKQYAMRDGADNEVVKDQIVRHRMMALTEYINSRTLESASYVSRVGGTEEDYGWL